ncbi:hypothetical protein WN51_12300 [Melipona quadrifasciata]|uniref:Uncharacterized protein n=1 Tax=Melipona quadrifasciata TaxID=166423 RepID=A0A0N0BKZ6_9HYME|nr:hypothetical protein WN51_12300 [Melipona quadrifasciata]
MGEDLRSERTLSCHDDTSCCVGERRINGRIVATEWGGRQGEEKHRNVLADGARCLPGCSADLAAVHRRNETKYWKRKAKNFAIDQRLDETQITTSGRVRTTASLYPPLRPPPRTARVPLKRGGRIIGSFWRYAKRSGKV